MHKHLVESRDPRRSRKITGILLILLLVGFLIQFVGSISSHSSSVMSDSFHMLVDGSSQLTYWLVLAIAIWSTQTPKWIKKRYPSAASRLKQVNVSSLWMIGDFASAIFLFGAAFTSITFSLRRLVDPQEVHVEVSISVAVIGLMINLLSLLVILASNTQDDLKGVFLHVKSDLYDSITVIVGQVLVWVCGPSFQFIDSLLGLYLGKKMIEWAWGLHKAALQGKTFHVKGIFIQYPAHVSHGCSSHGHGSGEDEHRHSCNHH
ncbi:cation transporter [Shimazuella sp. AN120528]|uniref:cation transporter n=1 Tax=Shimazuella soli TaxID=1892854 RepID=UPI001F0E5045|nr:cation transporter [Shimazuella soli]MCH5584807.1 cation transporter [Shimazuella soli]